MVGSLSGCSGIAGLPLLTHCVTRGDLRNLGDDGLATWADQNADANDSFDHDTVQYPILANGIAIYGGHDNFVTDNRVIDAGLTQGGGIHVAQRFASTTLGRTDVLRNTLIRDGSLDPNWNFGVGALVAAKTPRAIVDKLNADITALVESQEVSDQIRKLGCDPLPMTVKEFEGMIAKEIKENGELIKKAGIKAN